MLPPVYVVGEDDACCALAKKILQQLELGDPRYEINTYGYGNFVKEIEGMNNVAANAMHVFMLADGDQGLCIVEQVRRWMPAHPADRFILRLAVREAESWVLADREGFSRFAQVSQDIIPREPDKIENSKQHLLSIVRKGKSRLLKDEMLPGKRSNAPVGLGYNDHLKAFIREEWCLERAIQNSPSLARAIPRLTEKFL